MRDHKPLNIESALAYIPLFDGLSPEESAAMAQSAREIRGGKGQILFQKGDACTGIHVLLYGQAKLAFPSSQGAEKIIEVVQQGQTFGQAFLFLEAPYSIFAQALADFRVLHIPKAAILDAFRSNPHFARAMLADMAMRELQLMRDVETYSLLSGKQRVVGYLIEEIQDKNQDCGNAVVHLPVSKGVIASRLNLTQEHFSRILHDLAEIGLISVAGKSICIPSVADLRMHQLA